ncbi:Stp1/IreP family PP2C-type Ser/Thr phosphatase [Ligilactobacillus sp. WILCCON 0076]|uniref:protein-serine/threonine phosphatase n=1 Tax=Ligilactobacillus ubinensis TaxID=2876789 RepID=A0A9X2FK07_9LACO|nr:Stp1/IreP family PP2C-type Ser/Thr phosphatase [Ligilactobacillus ubinensis]MCP0886997.1 Stp1/IreP family PP2C-type Ser/Thr phosphatase [Ligilactobacillus ubinensis]
MDIAYQSDVGRAREKNEDSVGYFKNKAGVIFAIVADGLGGHQGGEVASEMAVSHLGYQFEQTNFEDLQKAIFWLENSAKYENEMILKRADQYYDLNGMGTTLVCVLVFKDSFVLANIGDSRGYLLREGKLSQLTEDHSLVNELVKRGEISAEEARNHPQKNIITRTLGISNAAKLDINSFAIQKDDYILLCSDGLTNMLTNDQLQDVVKDKNLSLTSKCQKLIKSANAAGGSDNITLLLMHLDREVSD